MKWTPVHRPLLSIIAVFAICCLAYTLSAQETTLQLPTNDDTSSFNVSKNNGTSVLKVDGTGRITGDGSGLSNVKPVAAYVGGNMNTAITSTDQVVKSVTITVPSAGKIIVNAVGFVEWTLTVETIYRLSITTGTSIDYDYMIAGSRTANADITDQADAFAAMRGYTVGSAGTYTYNLIGDTPLGDTGVNIRDVNMTAMFFPTSGTGKIATQEEEPNITGDNASGSFGR